MPRRAIVRKKTSAPTGGPTRTNTIKIARARRKRDLRVGVEVIASFTRSLFPQ
jgi:hypothetical protein